jgi:hypothetical protein
MLELSNDNLDSLICEMQAKFPNAGYQWIDGQVRQRGILVQQHRLRESVHLSTDQELILTG